MRAFQFQAPRKAQPTANAQVYSGEGAQEAGEEKKQEDEVTPGKAIPLSRASLFRTKDGKSADTYQRVLRLSPWKQADDPSSVGTRVGAITTGMASSGEVVLFSATESPSDSDVIGRIRLGNDEEAEDVDFASLENGRFRLAYTNGVDVVVGETSSSTRSNAAPDVRTVYTIPLPSSGARAARPKFRALRFLTPTVLLLLQNAPERSGSELVLLSLPTAKHAQGQVLRRRKLPRSVKIGLGLDVCPLGANPAGQEQTIIAASGSDNSISLWTLEYGGPNKGYGPIRSYTTLRDVHPFSMTRLCFSTFAPPAHPITPEVGPQKVKLASVSMGNTVVVHTLPLLPFPPSSRTARYVLTLPGPSEIWDYVYFLFALLASLVLGILALLAFAEIRGATPPMLGAINLVPEDWRNTIAVDYIPPPPHQRTYLDTIFPPERYMSIPSAQAQVQTDPTTPLESLKEILDRVHRAGAAPADLDTASPQALSVIVRCNQDGVRPDQSVMIETAASQKEHGAPSEEDRLRAWHELSSQDQALWKDRLATAGRWTMDQGEAVLKGVFFSEACGQLGDWVREEL